MSQSENESHRRTDREGDELRLLRLELTATRAALGDALSDRDALAVMSARYKAQLRRLRVSRSWRYTRPFRVVRRAFLGKGRY